MKNNEKLHGFSYPGKLPEKIVEKVRLFVEKEKLFSIGDKILVSLSGGKDSLALLLILMELSGEFKLELSLFYLDHMIRPEAKKESDELSRLAEKLGLPFSSAKFDVPRLARLTRSSLEDAARRARYHFLEKERKRTGSTLIATGHTASDQLETLIFRLINSNDITMLGGIRPKLGSIIRPVLVLTSKETEECCRAAGLTPFEDRTNFDITHPRNFIRARIVPLLLSLSPAAELNACELAASLRKTQHSLEKIALEKVSIYETDTGLSISLSELNRLDSVLFERLVKYLTARLGWNVTISREELELLFFLSNNRKTGKYVEFSRAKRVFVGFEKLRFISHEMPQEDFSGPSGQNLKELIPGIPLEMKKIKVTLFLSKEPDRLLERSLFENENSFKFMTRVKASLAPFSVRAFLPGDRYGCTKLKEMFSRAKIDSFVRASLPVIVDSSGKIVWCPPLQPPRPIVSPEIGTGEEYFYLYALFSKRLWLDKLPERSIRHALGN